MKAYGTLIVVILLMLQLNGKALASNNRNGIDLMINPERVVAAPENLTAFTNSNNVTLLWQEPNPDSSSVENGVLLSEVEAGKLSLRTRITGYRVFRNGILLNETSSTTLTYTDANLAESTASYYVKALNDGIESVPSNTVQVSILPGNYVELFHDDSIPEMGITVGYSNQLAVFFDYGSEVTIYEFKVFLHTLGTSNLIGRIYDNDGANSAPGSQYIQFTQPLASLHLGWNTIELHSTVTDSDGGFYLAIFEATGAAQKGVDTSSAGLGYTKIGGIWSSYTLGNIMLRCIVEPTIDPFGSPIVLPGSMNLMANVTIDSEHANSNDVLAAYAEVNGVCQLRGKQTIQMIDGIAACLIQIHTVTDGELINFEVWKRSTNEIFQCSTVTTTEMNGTIGTWPEDLFLIEAYTSTLQEISLGSGWNLISLNISPISHELATLLLPISSFVTQVKGTEGVYIPGNPYSSLQSIADGKAYHILMNAPAIWSISGIPISVETPLPLNEGWNLVSYLPQSNMNVTLALQSISPYLIQAKGSDGVYIPGNPYSTLTTMYPGKGYWMKLNAAQILTYPTGRSDGQSAALPNSGIEITKYPLSMVFLARCDWAEAGDILIAKCNDEIRGAQPITNLEGFPAALMQIFTNIADEEICLSLKKPDGTVLEIANKFRTTANESCGDYPDFIVLELITPQNIMIPDKLHGAYPNPFNPSTTISYQVAMDNTPVSIAIYNLKGQKVRKLAEEEYPKGHHRIVWDGKDDKGQQMGSGMYLISLKTATYSKTMKAMLVK